MNMDSNQKIPLNRPFLGDEEQEAIIKVMASKAIASGEVTRMLEDSLADKFERRYCVLVNSGTCALYLALKILGIKKVIFPAMICADVLYAILNAGSEAVFADIESSTHNIDLPTLKEQQFYGADGLIVTHTYCHSADMDVVAQYIKKYHLILIEDFSQAAGGYFNEKILGSFGKVSITSFYAAKIMTTGQGGAILTDDPELYRKFLYARGDKSPDYYSDIIPLNYRITDIQSAMGLVQLKKLDKMVDLRRNIAHRLTLFLRQLDVKTPIERPGVRHTYYKYHLILPEYARKREFISEMGKEGIATGILFDPPLHKTLLAKEIFGSGITLPVSESMATRVVSLPIFPDMTDGNMSRICDVIGNVLNNSRLQNIVGVGNTWK